MFLCDLITHPCLNFNRSLTKPPLKLGHGWEVTTHSYIRDHFVYVPSQWEMMLQCNVVSHCLGTYTIWSLLYDWMCNYSPMWLILTLNMLNCFKDYKRCIHISNHILDFVQQKKTGFPMQQPYILPILYSQYHWPHKLEYSISSIRRVNAACLYQNCLKKNMYRIYTGPIVK